MSPEYNIKCRACGFEQDLLTTYAKFEWVISVLPCEKCGKVDWIKLPATPSLKRDGTYSYREKK